MILKAQRLSGFGLGAKSRHCAKQDLKATGPSSFQNSVMPLDARILSGIRVSQPQAEKMTLSSKESWTIVRRVASGRIRRSLP